jgi:hypothetical protein
MAKNISSRILTREVKAIPAAPGRSGRRFVAAIPFVPDKPKDH